MVAADLPSIIVRDGSAEDRAAKQLCIQALESPDFPDRRELRARLDVVRGWPRPELLSVARKSEGYVDCWVRPEHVVLDSKRTAPPGESDWFPYHHTEDELVEITYQEMRGDFDLLNRLGRDLWLSAVAHPHGVALYVSSNGNHRSVGAAMGKLPYMPARVSVATQMMARLGVPPRVVEAPGPGRVGPYAHRSPRWYAAQYLALHLIEADGLISDVEGRQIVGELASDFRYSHDSSAIPWIIGWDLVDAPTGLAEYEARFGPLCDERYDWLRSHEAIGSRLAHVNDDSDSRFARMKDRLQTIRAR